MTEADEPEPESKPSEPILLTNWNQLDDLDDVSPQTVDYMHRAQFLNRESHFGFYDSAGNVVTFRMTARTRLDGQPPMLDEKPHENERQPWWKRLFGNP